MSSYLKKRAESIRSYKEIRQIHSIDKIGYKLRGHKFAKSLGVNCAIIYGIFNCIEKVDWNKLPDSFIIKPQAGCSESGVFPLLRKKEGTEYRNILKQKDMSIDEVISEYKAGIHFEQNRHSKGLWIEELLSNPLPYDWKLHTFNGKIGIIEQFKRDGEIKYHKYWTEEWKPAGAICDKEFTYKNNMELPEPFWKRELIVIAKKISKAVQYPYVRVDLLENHNGVFFGELTPHPGMTCKFCEKWDKKLGKLWELAERELYYE